MADIRARTVGVWTLGMTFTRVDLLVLWKSTVMAAMAPDDVRMKTPNWTSQEDQNLSAGSQSQSSMQHPPTDEPHPNHESENPPGYHRGSSVGDISVSGSKSDSFRDGSHKQAKVLIRSFPSSIIVLHLPLLCAHLPFPFSLTTCAAHRPHCPWFSVVFWILRGVVSQPSPPDGFLTQHTDMRNLMFTCVVYASRKETWCSHLFLCSQPNKVYIGGLPEQTREADLQNCFGKIGNIANIELKCVLVFAACIFCGNAYVVSRVGYGFVVRQVALFPLTIRINPIGRNLIPVRLPKRA